MAYDGWMEYNGVELFNVSRTAQLADALGITAVWIRPSQVQWIQDDLGGVGYHDITQAPWYDAGHPPSTEFAGIMPLRIVGLGDSTTSATTTEFITDGGTSHGLRNATLPIVAEVSIIASTERGAEFGKRWLDRLLRGSPPVLRCAGSDLTYFRYANPKGTTPAPRAHYRDVTLTRGTSITRQSSNNCSVVWSVTFTLTANDPYEYGDEVVIFEGLGAEEDFLGFGEVPFGHGPFGGYSIGDQGSLSLTAETCPVYDYTPIYDPLYPALVPSPTAPEFYPAGWDLEPGRPFERFWTRITPVDPTALRVVPIVRVTTEEEARMIRVSIWPAEADNDTQCDPLWTTTMTYLPPNMDFYIDGEQKAAYVWDGASPVVRRTDTLVFGMDATPILWTAFNDPDGLLVTLDVFETDGLPEGGGTVRAALSLMAKSD